MRKSRSSNGEGDETVHSELSRGYCVTVDYKVALTIYLVHLPSHNYFMVEFDVEEKLNESGNGGGLDDDCDGTRDFDNTLRKVKLERSRVLLGDYGIEQTDKGYMKSVLLHVGDNMDPYEVKVPKSPSPDNWVDPFPNTSKGGLTFDKVDNPGGCISFF